MRTQAQNQDKDVFIGKVCVDKKETVVFFRDGPMVRVRIEKTGDFYREVERSWNQPDQGGRDPHEQLTGVPSEAYPLSLSYQHKFLEEFLRCSAAAIRVLDHGQEASCASLEHHALAAEQSS